MKIWEEIARKVRKAIEEGKQIEDTSEDEFFDILEGEVDEYKQVER